MGYTVKAKPEGHYSSVKHERESSPEQRERSFYTAGVVIVVLAIALMFVINLWLKGAI